MYTLRPYETRDLAKVEALDARVETYRPEDAAEVEAMYARAAVASRPADRWGRRYSSAFQDLLKQGYLACWLAVDDANGDGEVAGVVALRRPQDSPEMGDLSNVAAWLARTDVAELKHLRVAPEARRQGVGAALVRRAVDWCRERGFPLLVLSTTTPQFPARRLYERLGFRAVGMTHLEGKYEVVWYELRL